MTEYHKIQSLWKRDPENNYKTFLTDHFTTREFEYLFRHNATFVGTEKVDGTNIRVIWDEKEVTFAGRTDRAQIPLHLLAVLEQTFTPERLSKGLTGPAVLYGEGFGPKIQSGGGYGAEPRFILFDVNVTGIWLAAETVTQIAEDLEILRAKDIFIGSLSEATYLVRHGFASQIEGANVPAEGLVLRPPVELLDRLGGRIITKLKTKDFKHAERA